MAQNLNLGLLGQYIDTTANSVAFSSNVVVSNTSELVFSSNAGIVANGSLGTAGQVLASNGSSVYWTTTSGGASVTVSATAPGSPTAGDLWWNSNLGSLYVYYNDGDSSQWVVASPTLPAINTTTVGKSIAIAIVFGG
jgi:hypothetical protein